MIFEEQKRTISFMDSRFVTITSTKNQQILEQVDFCRIATSKHIDSNRKSENGQFMTPATIARFMASFFEDIEHSVVTLLDPGAGIGSLSTAFVEEFCNRKKRPDKMHIEAFETDSTLFNQLNTTLNDCSIYAGCSKIALSYEIRKEDFISVSANSLNTKLFDKTNQQKFTHAIINPPYKKIRNDSTYRKHLSSLGMDTSNLYTGFILMAIELLQPNGELVAITPRSFCNGPYFKTFRKLMFEKMQFKHIHIFESRDEIFREEGVLQENIIFHAIKNKPQQKVCISSSVGQDFEHRTLRWTGHDQIVKPNDPDLIIHIAKDELDQCVLDRIEVFENSLEDLGIEVSTGRIVDFRLKKYLRKFPENNTVPLIYPEHFKEGLVSWPKTNCRKFNAFISTQNTQGLLLPKGYYVNVKRFSPKEEYHRINPALYDPNEISSDYVAFENHLNVFHCKNKGLSETLARGLYLFLSSSLVDIYFRQFNGHTQVNASDLRMLRYPDRKILERLGIILKNEDVKQEVLDDIIEKEVHKMAKITSPNPIKAKKKIEEALKILKSLGFPRAQQNNCSALVLLALVDIKPKNSWANSKARMIGITPIMDFCKTYYGKNYAPNSRETFRRQTMHQFIAGALVVENPDSPNRAINSPKWCYQIELNALDLIKSYGTKKWKSNLKKYLETVDTLKKRYAKERKMKMIPVKVTKQKKVSLTPGKHNELIRSIIQEFAPRFTPGGKVIYVGDTGDKWAYFDKINLQKLGVTIDCHGKMPDVVIYYEEKKLDYPS